MLAAERGSEDGLHNESVLLANCYRNSLALAEINIVKSIAFPCITISVYGLTHTLAMEIAIQMSLTYLSDQQSLLRITFYCFLESDLEIYQRLLGRVLLG
jgi:O-acetyl-ADP-ribose deacetylase (regulator of RNase III)